MQTIQCAIVGVSGYGATHLECVQELEREGLVKLQAVAEAYPQRCLETLAELKSRGVRVYDSYQGLLRHERELELVSVPVPIHLHVPIALACFERGMHVLLEKPPAVLVQDVDRLLAAAERHGCLCQVGFQSAFDPAMLKLRTRLADGAIGRVREMVVLGASKRWDGYYKRANWAGKLRVGDDWVLDGPLNNPLIHFVHQALLIACPREHESLRPLTARAELYRAHPIEGEDIVCARAELEGGITLLTYLTLCAPESVAPTVRIIGEQGSAVWQQGRFELEGPSGREELHHEAPLCRLVFDNMVRALRGEEKLHSPLSATRNVILHNNGCFLSAGRIRPVPSPLVRRFFTDAGDHDVATEVEDLPELIAQAVEARRLFSEIGVEWARPTPTVQLDFDWFDPSPLLG